MVLCDEPGAGHQESAARCLLQQDEGHAVLHPRFEPAGILLGVALGATFVVGNSRWVVWSPYYRISLSPEYGDGYQLSVDHDFHQDALDLRPPAIQIYPQLKAPLAYYDLPHKMAHNCRMALVIGAGTGNESQRRYALVVRALTL